MPDRDHGIAGAHYYLDKIANLRRAKWELFKARTIEGAVIIAVFVVLSIAVSLLDCGGLT